MPIQRTWPVTQELEVWAIKCLHREIQAMCALMPSFWRDPFRKYLFARAEALVNEYLAYSKQWTEKEFAVDKGDIPEPVGTIAPAAPVKPDPEFAEAMPAPIPRPVPALTFGDATQQRLDTISDLSKSLFDPPPAKL